MPGYDKRISPRLHVTAANYVVYTEGSGAIRDLSVGGVFIEDTSPLPEGTIFGFDLRLGADLVPVRGVVRRSVPGTGMGVQFQGLAGDSRNKLERFVANLEKSLRQPKQAAAPPPKA